MSTLESTISMLRVMPETDVQVTYRVRLFSSFPKRSRIEKTPSS